MTYPIECSDEYGLEGIKDSIQLVQWLNSWISDPDSTECRIRKVPAEQAFNPVHYTLAPADAGK